MRWMMLASDVVILGTSILLIHVAGHGRGWSWPYLVWGILLAPLWFVAMWLLQVLSVAGLPDSAWIRPDGTRVDRRAFVAAGRARDLRTRWVVYVGLVVLCISAGIISAGLRSAVPDAIMTVMILVLGLALPLLIVRVFRRRIIEGRHHLPLSETDDGPPG